MKKLLVILASVIVISTHAQETQLTVNSKLQSVTVYRSGAELNHNVNISLKQGNNDVVVEDIANSLDQNSLQVSCPAGVTVMGLTFSNNYMKPAEPSIRLKVLTDSSESIQKDIAKMSTAIQIQHDLLSVLNANREVKGTQVHMNVAELTKLMDYYRSKSFDIQTEITQLNEKRTRKQEQLNKITIQIAEEEARNTKVTGRLLLQLYAATAVSGNYTITYLTPNAHWLANYDIRVDKINTPVKIIYKGQISQTTGIDWKKVKLALSTSLPSQYSNVPELQPLFVGYYNPYTRKREDVSDMLAGRTDGVSVARSGQPGAAARVQIRGQNSIVASSEPLYIVDGVPVESAQYLSIPPNNFKSVEVLKDATATALYGSRAANGVIIATTKQMSDYVSATNKELNVVFDVELPYDVPTNGKPQLATLREYEVAAQYQYSAVPKMNLDAFLVANITDWEKLNLVAGSAQIMFEGTFVGKTTLDPAAVTDTLKLTLGKDKRIVIRRDKLADVSSIKLIGTNKKQQLVYEVTIRNNKKDAISLNLKDQYPISTDKDIEVELVDDGKAEVNRETGILNWTFQLAPGETKKLRFSYSVKWPKDKVINL